jgi:hypothetical protein
MRFLLEMCWKNPSIIARSNRYARPEGDDKQYVHYSPHQADEIYRTMHATSKTSFFICMLSSGAWQL